AFRCTQWELRISERFYSYSTGTWPARDTLPWSLVYRYGEWPGVAMGIAACLLTIASPFLVGCRKRVRCWLYLILVVAVGPGLLVNEVLKPGFGRPRPAQLEQFGGDHAFAPVLSPTREPGCFSFPSGHAAMGFAMIAPWFVLRRRRSGLARCFFWGGLVWGCIVGITRIAQGGHFAGDVVGSFLVVYVTSLALYVLLRPDRAFGETASDCETECSPKQTGRKMAA
ncbi:MAG: phosphatase PAP2 family protein, partial [Planctomycetota bacterium]